MSENVSKIEEVKEELNEVTENLVTQTEETPQTQVASELGFGDKVVKTFVAYRPVVKRLLMLTAGVIVGGVVVKVVGDRIKNSSEASENGEVLEGDFTISED